MLADAAKVREDWTWTYLQSVMRVRAQPPSYAQLPAELHPLSAPLPVSSLTLQCLHNDSFNHDHIWELAVNVEEQWQPSIELSEAISNRIWDRTEGEGAVLQDMYDLVLKPMIWVLGVYKVQADLGSQVPDPFDATETQQLPAGMLFLRKLLMFKACAASCIIIH